MKIGIPVKCQNNHKAVWVIVIHGLDVSHEGVPKENKCDCPKRDYNQGYQSCGEPYLL